MTDNHPITPPPELVQEWRDAAFALFEDDEYPDPLVADDARDEHIAIQAARWGADQELEACCEWLTDWRCNDPSTTMLLRDDRRPKPPSLKEQALAVLEGASKPWSMHPDDIDIIRRALEALPE